MPESQRAELACDDCGQSDDHPKVHYGDVTYHHDCLPPRARHDVLANPLAEQIVKACEKGKKGAKLLAHIESLHASENSED